MEVTFKSSKYASIEVDGQTHRTNEKLTASKEFVAAVKEQFPDVHVTEHKAESNSGGTGGNAGGNS